MQKKVLSFRIFFNEFIKSNTRFGIRQSLNQIFYGSLSSEEISQSLAAKIRTEDYVFSPGIKIFKKYILSGDYSIKDKSNFIKKLNLSNLPTSGTELCDRLKDYYLSNELYCQLRNEPDVYIALVLLLEHIMYGKDLFPKESMNSPINTIDNVNCINNFWNSELKKAISIEGKAFPLDSFKEPLGWYIRLISNHTKLNSSKIAKQTHLSHTTFNRKTNPNAKRKRHLYLSDIQEICRAMKTSLGSILYCFENRQILETTPELIDHLCILNTESDEFTSSKNQPKMEKLLADSEKAVFEKWIGKYYCYFSSTNSKETFTGKKEFAGKHCLDDNYKDLAELFTDDHIYSGILTIDPPEDSHDPKCIANFKFMVDPERPIIKEYTGTVTISKNKQAVFIQLYSKSESEISFLIVEDIKGNRVKCATASVLTISSRENHRKPCSERMIISKERFFPNTQSYQVMKANLKMHDKYIRIDSFGFDEVIKELRSSGDPKSIDIANKYNKLEQIGPLNAVERKELAYIKDTYISNLTNLTEEQKVIFESSLRLHSIAPWYAKANSKKVRDLIELIQDHKNN